MPCGGDVTIKTYTEGQSVVLSIRDQGKGIDPSQLAKLGTPFFTTKENGKGLGLAVCYQIAQNHSAQIHIDSDSSGTEVKVTFYT